MKYEQFLPYLLTMALVTYAVRAIPLVLIRRKIKNQFILSFLYYMPYAVLSVMTVPAVFFVTNHIITAASGVVVALILAFFATSVYVIYKEGGIMPSGTAL